MKICMVPSFVAVSPVTPKPLPTTPFSTANRWCDLSVPLRKVFGGRTAARTFEFEQSQPRDTFGSAFASAKVSEAHRAGPSVEDSTKHFAALSRAAAAVVLAGGLLFANPETAWSNLLPGPPRSPTYALDDAKTLNGSTVSSINKYFGEVEKKTGVKVEGVVIRRIEDIDISPDMYAKQLLEEWFPDAAEQDKAAVLLLVTRIARAGFAAGPSAAALVSPGVLESILDDTIGIPARDNRYNEAIDEGASRLSLVMTGQPDPGPPKIDLGTGEGTFATAEDTEANRGTYTTIVVVLLVIATVVPMLQYYGYVGFPWDRK